jgi:hypothetical protein
VTHRTKAWLCLACGHLLDAMSEVTGANIAPVEGDLTMCIGCGAFYTLQDGAWAKMTPEQYAALAPDDRALVFKMQLAQKRLPPAKVQPRN